MNLQTMSVLSVMRSLRSEVDAGTIRPYCFVEINGLKLASPENIYRVWSVVVLVLLNGHTKQISYFFLIFF